MPSVSTRTRSPDRPRSTGAEAVGPKLVAETPGWLASVSPMLGRTSRVRSAWSSTDTPPSTSPALRRTPVTMISSSWSRCRVARRGRGARPALLRRAGAVAASASAGGGRCGDVNGTSAAARREAQDGMRHGPAFESDFGRRG